MPKTTKVKPSAAYTKWLAVLKSGKIEEREIIAFRKMLNGYSKTSITEGEKSELLDKLWNKPLNITKEQSDKGLAFLLNQWKTPRGIERKNNPFGYREEDVLENFKKFTFSGVYDNSTYTANQMGYHNYLAIYTVISKDGSAFEYYYDGTVNIIG